MVVGSESVERSMDNLQLPAMAVKDECFMNGEVPDYNPDVLLQFESLAPKGQVMAEVLDEDTSQREDTLVAMGDEKLVANEDKKLVAKGDARHVSLEEEENEEEDYNELPFDQTDVATTTSKAASLSPSRSPSSDLVFVEKVEKSLMHADEKRALKKCSVFLIPLRGHQSPLVRRKRNHSHERISPLEGKFDPSCHNIDGRPPTKMMRNSSDAAINDTSFIPSKKIEPSDNKMLKHKRNRNKRRLKNSRPRIRKIYNPYPEWPSLPAAVDELMQSDLMPYIFTVLSHLLGRNFSRRTKMTQALTRAVKKFLPDWVENPSDMAGYTPDLRRKVVAYLIDHHATKSVEIRPLDMGLQRVEVRIPVSEKKHFIPGTRLERFLNYHHQAQPFLRSKLFVRLELDPELENQEGLYNHCQLIRWFIQRLIGPSGDRFVTCMVKGEPEKKQRAGKLKIWKYLQNMVKILQFRKVEKMDSEQRLTSMFDTLYRYRNLAAKIGVIGWAEDGTSHRLSGSTCLTHALNPPMLYRSVSDMNPQEVRSFLLRGFMYLDQRRPGWRSEFFGEAESTYHPTENDVEHNRQLLHKLLIWVPTFGGKQSSAFLTHWPPLPRKIEQMSFPETVAYIQLLVLHLSGYQPNIANPKDKPCYWGSVWGLPTSADLSEDLNAEWETILGHPEKMSCKDPLQRWMEFQKSTIAQVGDCYAPQMWHMVDEDRYLQWFEREFPFIGRHHNYDMVALRRFRIYAEIYSPHQSKVKQKAVIGDLFSRFPCLPITTKMMVLSLMDIRGFLLELVFHLLGFRPFWDEADRPEFWPQQQEWLHPFSSKFSDSDILAIFAELLSRFAPQHIGVLPRVVAGENIGYEGVNIMWNGWQRFGIAKDVDVGFHFPTLSNFQFLDYGDFEPWLVKRDELVLASETQASSLQGYTSDSRGKGRARYRPIKLPSSILANCAHQKKRKVTKHRPSSSKVHTRNVFNFDMNIDSMNNKELHDYALTLQNHFPDGRVKKGLMQAKDISELRAFLSDFSQFGSRVSLNPVPGKIHWPPLPCSYSRFEKNHDETGYAATLVRILNNEAHGYDPKKPPPFWPKGIKWGGVNRMSMSDIRALSNHLFKKFCVNPNDVPICKFEFECIRTDVSFNHRLKISLGFSKSDNIVKVLLLSLYPKQKQLLCAAPGLPCAMEQVEQSSDNRCVLADCPRTCL